MIYGDAKPPFRLWLTSLRVNNIAAFYFGILGNSQALFGNSNTEAVAGLDIRLQS